MRSDDTIAQIGRSKLPFIILDAFMQRDPQAILLHEENPISSFADLNGKSIMAIPGTSWFDYLQRHYHITLNLIPSNYGLAQFMADKNFIQQCFITNEPYFRTEKRRQAQDSAHRRFWLQSIPRNRVEKILCARSPDVIRAFVAASVKGWMILSMAIPRRARQPSPPPIPRR